MPWIWEQFVECPRCHAHAAVWRRLCLWCLDEVNRAKLQEQRPIWALRILTHERKIT